MGSLEQIGNGDGRLALGWSSGITAARPSGKLRVAINMRNALLVTGKAENGDPIGLAPSMAAEIAQKAGVPLELVQYGSVPDIDKDGGKDVWDLALVGADPAREAHVQFTAPYCEIEAAYCVKEGSKFQATKEIDSEGIQIAVCKGAAYHLWLQRNIKNAKLVECDSHDSTYETFLGGDYVLAGLKSKIAKDAAKLPGTRLLPGKFMAVEQAVAVKKGREQSYQWLKEFVEECKSNGTVKKIMEKHGVDKELAVAPLSSKL